MSDRPPNDVTLLLNRLSSGDQAAGRELLAWLHQELRRLAHAKDSRFGPDPTQPATAIVHEAYMRLIGDGRGIEWANRRHFFAAAAKTMRHIRIDDERKGGRLKRGGDHRPLPLETDAAVFTGSPVDLLAIDEALTALQQTDPRKVELIELRFFVGLTEEETASALGLSRRTVQLEWQIARAWMHRFLTRGDTHA